MAAPLRILGPNGEGHRTIQLQPGNRRPTNRCFLDVELGFLAGLGQAADSHRLPARRTTTRPRAAGTLTPPRLQVLMPAASAGRAFPPTPPALSLAALGGRQRLPAVLAVQQLLQPSLHARRQPKMFQLSPQRKFKMDSSSHRLLPCTAFAAAASPRISELPSRTEPSMRNECLRHSPNAWPLSAGRRGLKKFAFGDRRWRRGRGSWEGGVGRGLAFF
jgi:hypothetical protein